MHFIGLAEERVQLQTRKSLDAERAKLFAGLGKSAQRTKVVFDVFHNMLNLVLRQEGGDAFGNCMGRGKR